MGVAVPLTIVGGAEPENIGGKLVQDA